MLSQQLKAGFFHTTFEFLKKCYEALICDEAFRVNN